MPSWTVDAPKRLDFDDVTALNVRLMAGSVAVPQSASSKRSARSRHLPHIP
jgi:hypothetical protein